MMFRAALRGFAVIALVLFVGQAARADDDVHEGTVVKAGEGKLTMKAKGSDDEHEHTVASDATVTLDGKDCKLADLKAGFSVKVTTKAGDKKTAIKIEGKSKD